LVVLLGGVYASQVQTPSTCECEWVLTPGGAKVLAHTVVDTTSGIASRTGQFDQACSEDYARIEQLWREVVKSGEEKRYADFLAQYPHHRHAAQARRAIEREKDEELREADNPREVATFIRENPSDPRIPKAEAKLSKLLKDEQEQSTTR
jgi:hypothetical protein